MLEMSVEQKHANAAQWGCGSKLDCYNNQVIIICKQYWHHHFTEIKLGKSPAGKTARNVKYGNQKCHIVSR